MDGGKKSSDGKPADEPTTPTSGKQKDAEGKDKKDDGKEKPKRRSLGDDIDNLGNPKDDKKEEPKDEDAEWDRPETPRKLRDAYKKTKGEVELSKKRIGELEQLVAKTKQETEDSLKKDWEPRLAESEKRRSELETELRFLDYSRSEDYKAQFQTPWEEGWKAALSEFEGLKVTAPDGSEREFAPQDLHALINMPNFRAREIANAMFGTAAPDIMRHRAEIMRLTGARDKALNEWKQKGSERDAQIAAQRKETVKRWSDSIETFRGEYPELFGEREADSDGNKLLRDGNSLVRAAFLGEGIPEGLTSDQRREIILDAQSKVGVRAMAYGRAMRDLKKAEARISELEGKLKGYEGSEPEPGGHGGQRGDSGGGGKERSPEDEIDAIPGTRWG